MNVTFDKLSPVAAEVTVTLEEKDYADKVKKQLKEIGKTRPEPGFRPGHVPAGIIEKKYGKAVKYDVVNREIADALYNYINENKLKVLANPVPVANEDFNLDNADFTAKFKLGLAPEIKSPVSKEVHIPYYTIEVSEEMIDRENDALRRRFGEQVKGDTVEPDALVKGVITELNEDGTVKENGIVQENGIVAPKYFRSEEQRKLFEGKHVGDEVIFNPAATCDANVTEMSSMLNIPKEDVENHKGDFEMNITEIIVLRLAELNQEFFDQAFGKDKVHNEEEYRAAIKAMIAQRLAADSNYRFSIDARDVLTKAVGDVELPDDILKEYLINQSEGITPENVDEIYARERKELEWQLIREAVAEQLDIKLEESDLVNMAKAMAQHQFAQYGMTSVPDDVLTKYAKEILANDKQREQVANQALDNKLFNAIRASVTVDDKDVTVEQFNALFQPAEA